MKKLEILNILNRIYQFPLEENDVFRKSLKISKNALPLSHTDLSRSLDDGRTALHLAASTGNIEPLNFLLGCEGIKVNVKDRWGGSPLDDAKREKHGEVAKLLEGAGAQ